MKCSPCRLNFIIHKTITFIMCSVNITTPLADITFVIWLCALCHHNPHFCICLLFCISLLFFYLFFCICSLSSIIVPHMLIAFYLLFFVHKLFYLIECVAYSAYFNNKPGFHCIFSYKNCSQILCKHFCIHHHILYFFFFCVAFSCNK